VAELNEEIIRRDPKTIRAPVTILPPREQPLSAGVRHITGGPGNIANVREYDVPITQLEQASPAPQQPRSEPDTQWAATRWATVIGALERAAALAVASADAKRFKEGLRAARELRGRYGS
jgi:hypothetical protein